jgi:type II secretory pathway pseudopilin PulG
MFRTLRPARGFSAVEATIVLSATSILAATTMPAVGGYIDEARETRAHEEVRVVATAVSRVSNDLLSRAEVPGGLATLTLVVSPGDVPTVGTNVDQAWGQSGSGVGALNDHLIVNGVGYATQDSNLPKGTRGWSGPYLDRPLGADPWGHRYAVRFGHGKAATVVLSAGPDGVINTVDGKGGLVVGGDDIVSIISGR